MESGWSELPIDLLLSILPRLELPEILAFATVCLTWRSAATTAGVLPCRAPGLVSWASLPEERVQIREHGRRANVRDVFRTLVNPEKIYKASFPQRHWWGFCGASHGWLFLSDKLSNLVMCNPFTSTNIPLPPITDFTFVEAIGNEGDTMSYRIEIYGRPHDTDRLGNWFYQKVALSCTPSVGGDYTVMIIHRDCDMLSFARAGEARWHVASAINRRQDSYTDCVYHGGKFYTATMKGIVEMWDFDDPNEPKKEVIVTRKRNSKGLFVLTNRDILFSRHLVSTPWGELLQIRPVPAQGGKCPGNVKVKIDKVDVEGHRIVKLKPQAALRQHAVFLGINHSSCLPTDRFHELRPNCIYFTTPVLRQEKYHDRNNHGWHGVRIYDLENCMLEDVFPYRGSSEIWITPNY